MGVFKVGFFADGSSSGPIPQKAKWNSLDVFWLNSRRIYKIKFYQGKYFILHIPTSGTSGPQLIRVDDLATGANKVVLINDYVVDFDIDTYTGYVYATVSGSSGNLIFVGMYNATMSQNLNGGYGKAFDLVLSLSRGSALRTVMVCDNSKFYNYNNAGNNPTVQVLITPTGFPSTSASTGDLINNTDVLISGRYSGAEKNNIYTPNGLAIVGAWSLLATLAYTPTSIRAIGNKGWIAGSNATLLKYFDSSDKTIKDFNLGIDTSTINGIATNNLENGLIFFAGTKSLIASIRTIDYNALPDTSKLLVEDTSAFNDLEFNWIERLNEQMIAITSDATKLAVRETLN